MNKLVPFLCVAVLIVGCATSGTEILTPPVMKAYADGFRGGNKVFIIPLGGDGGPCFTEEAKAYLQGAQFDVVTLPGPVEARQLEELVLKSGADLVLSGSVERFDAGSDSPTRNASVGYLTAFIITAPIAGIYAATTSWKAYAVAAAKMTIVDARSDETVWTKRDNVGISAEGKSLSSEDHLKEMLLPRVCKDLTTKLLNDFIAAHGRGFR